MNAQRILAVVVLLVVGVLALPVVATFVDGEGNENWIVPVAVLVTAVVGAVVGRALPGLAGEGVSGGRAALVGAITGVVCLVVGLAVFFLLLSGFDGA